MPKSVLQRMTLNLQGDLVRDEKMAGEEYWVAPLTMMMECVADGSNGPMFYPAEECENGVPAWNHKPIVVPDHPGEGSACTKEFLDKHSIGLVLNTKWDGKLRSEGWFNKKRTTSVDSRVSNALKQRRMMELSTGLYVDPEPAKEGSEFNGEKYSFIAKNHRPDHLAILPDKIGAFSIKKGAGMLQLNEASFTEITGKLESALNENYADDIKKMPSLYLYVMSVYDSYCIYCFGGAYYKIEYKVSSDDSVSLVGDPIQVERKVDYVPVSNAEDPTMEDETMAKKDLVDKIIKNSDKTGYEESDRKLLDGLDEKKLERIAKNSEPTTTEVLESHGVKITSQKELDDAVAKGVDESIAKNAEGVKKKAEEAIAKNKKVDPPAEPPKEMSVEEFMAIMPVQFRQIHNNAMKSFENEVTQLVTIITNNKSNTFTKEQLVKMDIDMLRNMARLAQPAVDPNQNPQLAMPNFFGAASPMNVINNTVQEEALPLPTYNAEKFASANK